MLDIVLRIFCCSKIDILVPGVSFIVVSSFIALKKVAQLYDVLEMTSKIAPSSGTLTLVADMIIRH